jgi:hypothetical protein
LYLAKDCPYEQKPQFEKGPFFKKMVLGEFFVGKISAVEFCASDLGGKFYVGAFFAGNILL